MADISKKDYLANLYNQEEIIEMLSHVKGQVDIIIESNDYDNEEVARQLEELI